MKTLEPKVYIVGAGPGDPELITVKGSNILKNADLVLYTDSLVNDELIATAKSEAEVLQSSGMDLEQQVELMCTAVRAGRSVARVHTGDPAMYGAILEQMVLLKQQGVEYEIIPGVSSVFASAAALGAELTVPELTQTVILTRAEGRTLCLNGRSCAIWRPITVRWRFSWSATLAKSRGGIPCRRLERRYTGRGSAARNMAGSENRAHHAGQSGCGSACRRHYDARDDSGRLGA